MNDMTPAASPATVVDAVTDLQGTALQGTALHQPATQDRSTFASMDVSTAEQWAVIGQQTAANQHRTADSILTLLRSLAGVVDGFAIDQLTHCLQTATRAEQAGADEEVIVASLCHDIGKAISVPNHPAIAASILQPYVRPEVHFMIAAHQDFQGRHYYHHFGGNPDASAKYEGNESFALAERFADEWDQTAFDPDYPTYSLEHFEPMVRRVFGQAKMAVGR
jgi:predicted HD phosphohydrolase